MNKKRGSIIQKHIYFINNNQICDGGPVNYIKSNYTSSKHYSSIVKILDKVAFSIILLSAVIDSISGYLVFSHGIFGGSLSIKSILVVYAFFRLSISRKLYSLLLCIIFFASLFYTGLLSVVVKNDISWMVKCISLSVLFLYFRELFLSSSCTFWFAYGKKLILASYIIYAANILLGLLGYGKAQYSHLDQRLGGTGFIYAGNEMTTSLLVIVAILCIYFYKSSLGKKINWYGAFCFISLAKMTKASMLGTFIIILSREYFGSSNLRKVVIVIFSIIVIGVLLTQYLVPFLESAYAQRYLGFYDRYGLWGMVFSNRNHWVVDVWSVFSSTSSFSDYLFGRGAGFVTSIIGKEAVESDFFDFFFAYGLLGLIASLSVFIYVFILLIKEKAPIFNFFPFFLIFILVSFSGHILNGGICIPYVAYMFAFLSRK